MHRRKFIGSGSAFIAMSLMSTSASAKLPVSSSPKPRQIEKAVLRLKGIAIGEGLPKVIIPSTASNEREILQFVEKLAARSDFHIFELRLDPLDNGKDANAMAALSREVSARLQDKLLLLTFRTKAEGGKQAISDRDYAALYQSLLNEGQFDLLDIEMFRDRTATTPLIDLAHQQGKHVIMSTHEFHSTPPVQEIVNRLREQQIRGADILKVAVMPKDPADVITLMSATLDMYQHYAQRPLLTMAMGGTGVLSRIGGELYGSALTFAMAGKASAPGQIEVDELTSALNILHKGMMS